MQAEITYNWDDIEVGRFDLNHSENFFSQKHLKHEKFSEEFELICAMAEANISGLVGEIAIESPDNKENAIPSPHQQHQPTIDSPQTSKVEASPNKSDNKSSSSQTSSTSNRRPANLLTRPKTPQVKTKPTSSAPPAAKSRKPLTKAEPPHVYEFVDIYQKNKEEKMRKLLEEEKKNRIFHSRPAPRSITSLRELAENKLPQLHKVTVAKTPLVLKHSREAIERRKERLEEWKRKNSASKFSSREAVVLQEEPFKPKKTTRTITAQPFNLNVERRLEERKKYDEQHRRTVEEKKKQEEEERKRREAELSKELRKLAIFKARPNPFK